MMNSLTMYKASEPAFLQMLDALDSILTKAEAHATTRKIAPETLLQARLFPDMFSFTRQVQLACDFAMRTMARLSGMEPPSVPDTEKTFEELHARIARAVSYVKVADARAIDNAANKDITFPAGGSDKTLNGVDYLTRFALPHFYFHVTMAYAILRENGVDLGKRDYMGAVPGF